MGYEWAAEKVRPDNLDAGLLMWFLRRRVRVDRLPVERVTVQFEFRDADKRRFWLVLHRPATQRSWPVGKPPSAYAPELNLVECSWSSLAHRRIDRSRRTPHPAYWYLGHADLWVS